VTSVLIELGALLRETTPAECYRGSWVSAWLLYGDLIRLQVAGSLEDIDREWGWIDSHLVTMADEARGCPLVGSSADLVVVPRLPVSRSRDRARPSQGLGSVAAPLADAGTGGLARPRPGAGAGDVPRAWEPDDGEAPPSEAALPGQMTPCPSHIRWRGQDVRVRRDDRQLGPTPPVTGADTDPGAMRAPRRPADSRRVD
jgi:hypothetical protein